MNFGRVAERLNAHALRACMIERSSRVQISPLPQKTINHMIKGIILDVDGVIVGGKKGYNWPNPHPDVIRALQKLRSQGIIVSLCTGKGTFAIKEIVEAANLDNLHIGDGGAVVVDFLNNTIIEKHIVGSDTALRVLEIYQQQGVYVELYTIDGYYVQQDAVSDITKKHAAILYRAPVIVKSLQQTAKRLDVVKIMPVAKDEQDKQNVIALFEPFKHTLSLQWGIHPTALPLQFGIITLQHISKKQAAITISKNTKVPLVNMLGVGDGMTDWEFMQLCGYAGAMDNASEQLKNMVLSRKNNAGFIGPSVDENGLLGILEYFGLKY